MNAYDISWYAHKFGIIKVDWNDMLVGDPRREVLPLKGRPDFFGMIFIHKNNHIAAFFRENFFEFFCPRFPKKICLKSFVIKDRNVEFLELIGDVFGQFAVFASKRKCDIIFVILNNFSKTTIST